jgi:tryptophanyl-tRNA synthetase
MPSLKDMAKTAHLNEMPFGLLGYPVLQAADILLPRAHLVPVGKDNEAHVEITREIARRFNSYYGEVFPIPDVMVGAVPILVGTDGSAKMSKSLNNTVYLSDDRKTVKKKVFGMFIYHEAFNTDQTEVDELKERYKKGKVGDVEVKERLATALNRFLDPIRERREQFIDRQGYVEEVIYDGTLRMREEARETLSLVKKAMGIMGTWNRIRRKAEDVRKSREGH